MNCWALVAINTRLRRKGRLRSTLDAATRDALALDMLETVLAAAAGARTVDRVLIVSPDDQGLPHGYEVIHDTGAGLNEAFELALARGRAERVRELVLLPADLPQLAAADIDALVLAGRRSRIAMAPDRRGTGTNGLCVAADLDFRCRFGRASRRRHETEAYRLGIEPAIVTRAGLQADLDTPADLRSIGRSDGVLAGSTGACAERPA